VVLFFFFPPSKCRERDGTLFLIICHTEGSMKGHRTRSNRLSALLLPTWRNRFQLTDGSTRLEAIRGCVCLSFFKIFFFGIKIFSDVEHAYACVNMRASLVANLDPANPPECRIHHDALQQPNPSNILQSNPVVVLVQSHRAFQLVRCNRFF